MIQNNKTSQDLPKQSDYLKEEQRKKIDSFLKSFGLTQSQINVALLIGRGKRYKEAADILCVTTKTIEWHINIIYKKLNIKKKIELVFLLGKFLC